MYFNLLQCRSEHTARVLELIADEEPRQRNVIGEGGARRWWDRQAQDEWDMDDTKVWRRICVCRYSTPLRSSPYHCLTCAVLASYQCPISTFSVKEVAYND